MTTLDTYYLAPAVGNWNLRKEGTFQVLVSDPNKETATEKAAAYVKARGGSLRIHRLNGTFEEERTYPRSADPKSPG